MVEVPWQRVEDPPVVSFCEALYATSNLNHDKVNKDQNIIAVLTGTYKIFSTIADCPGFWHLSSLSVNNVSKGYYMDVAETEFNCLLPAYEDVEGDEGEGDDSNCEVVSILDTVSKVEVLVLRVTRPVTIGQPLCLKKRHNINFIITKRGHGRKSIFFEELIRPL